jgi:hypothetical protein
MPTARKRTLHRHSVTSGRGEGQTWVDCGRRIDPYGGPMEVRLAPPNSIIFIYDPTCSVEAPSDIGAGLVWATDSCVAVGTLAEMDGETTIRLAGDFADPQHEVAFEGIINTPGGVVAINTSLGVELVSIPVGQRARITVWANDASEPDLILVRAC